MSDERIPVRAEMWRQHGRWVLLVRGPRWLVEDVARESFGSGRGFHVANYGGRSDGADFSFLLEVDAQERNH